MRRCGTINIKQKKTKTMKTDWEISFGFYPGILFGFRSYVEQYRNNHVIYVPFVDICITKYKL